MMSLRNIDTIVNGKIFAEDFDSHRHVDMPPSAAGENFPTTTGIEDRSDWTNIDWLVWWQLSEGFYPGLYNP